MRLLTGFLMWRLSGASIASFFFAATFFLPRFPSIFSLAADVLPAIFPNILSLTSLPVGLFAKGFFLTTFLTCLPATPLGVGKLPGILLRPLDLFKVLFMALRAEFLRASGLLAILTTSILT